MSRVRTYILAPNFSLKDDSASPWYPWLGNIIADPLNPTHRVLSKLKDPPTDIATVTEVENEYTDSRGHYVNASLLANFFQIASANLGGERSKDDTVTYTMSGGVETKYFDPSDEEITARLQAEPKIQTVMNSGLFGKKPVYIVTGLKVAKGFSVSQQTENTLSGRIGGSMPIMPDGTISAGGEAGGQTRSGRASLARVEEGTDIIFAYQLHIIGMTGWRQRSRKIDTQVYSSRSAFLSSGKEQAESEFEASKVILEDIVNDEEVNQKPQIIELGIGDDPEVESCLCVIPPSKAE